MNRRVAGELLTSAWCPYDCAYCYIPKTDSMKGSHNKVEESLKDGTALRNLHKYVGNELKDLGLWGTEPTLTLHLIDLELVHELFPKLQTISFSTAMFLPNRIVDFVKKASKYNYKVKVQASIDGHAAISDVNRYKGAADNVRRWSITLAKELHGYNGFTLQWKSTLTPDNLRLFVGDPSEIDAYINYFKEINSELDSYGLKVMMSLPSLQVPGKYTSKDGKLFAQYLRLIHSKGLESAYLPRLRRILRFSEDLLTKRTMFTCSGGDSNCGSSGYMHLCHRSFYYDFPEYIESLRQVDMENWDVSLLEDGLIDLIRTAYIVGEEDMVRFDFVMRGYHDFWQLPLSTTVAMVRELAKAGQAEERFLTNDRYVATFATFVNIVNSCPMESILNTGSPHLVPVSMLRMFGNGAFAEILNELSRRK